MSVNFAAHFGLYTQWLNDLDGLESDLEEGQATPFGLIIGSPTLTPDTVAGGGNGRVDGKLDGMMRAALTHLATICGSDSHRTVATDNNKKSTDVDGKMSGRDEDTRVMVRSMQGFLAIKMLMGVAKHSTHFPPTFLQECEAVSPIRLDLLARLQRLGDAIMPPA